MEDDVNELPDSYFSKAAVRVFDKIDHGKANILPLSKFVELIETLGEGFHSEELVVHLWKLDPNKIISLDNFSSMRWYVDKEVYMDSRDEAERLVGWGYNVSLMDIQ